MLLHIYENSKKYTSTYPSAMVPQPLKSFKEGKM